MKLIRTCSFRCKKIRELFSLNTYAEIMEKLLLPDVKTLKAPQIFIFGLPRSGTTLIYQYIVHRLQVAYFTNGVGYFPVAPCLVTRVQHFFYGRYESDFKSRFGKNLGPVAPREAGGFWNRFLGVDNYVKYDSLPEEDRQTLIRTVGCVQHVFGGLPFVNKNVKHLLRVDALSKLFPDYFFLIVERSFTDVGISLLRARHEILSDPNEWWSVKPPDYGQLKNLPIVQQIAHQVLSLKKKMEQDLSLCVPHRVLRIHYDEFCADPEQLILRLEKQFGMQQTGKPAVQSFKVSRHEPHNTEEQELAGIIKHALS